MQETKKTSNQDTIDAVNNDCSNIKTEQRLILNQSNNSNKMVRSEQIGFEQSMAKRKSFFRGKSNSKNEK